MKSMKGQAAVEYLAILTVSLAILLPLWLFVTSVNSSTQDDLRVGFAKQLVSRIADASDLVLVQGPPAQFIVKIDVPSGVSAITLQNNEVNVRLERPYGVTDVFASTSGSIQGDIDAIKLVPGPHYLTVKAQRDAFGVTFVNVSVYEGGFS
ncbi:MAG: hypothetical protein V1834_00020 [Candidatus Micrarchaeota archaeon]